MLPIVVIYVIAALVLQGIGSAIWRKPGLVIATLLAILIPAGIISDHLRGHPNRLAPSQDPSPSTTVFIEHQLFGLACAVLPLIVLSAIAIWIWLERAKPN